MTEKTMNQNLSLQAGIDEMNELETLSLEFNEYMGPVVIDKPLIIDGNGSTLWATAGPVLTVNAPRVRIRNLRIEVTSPTEKEKEAGNLALIVDQADVSGTVTVSRGGKGAQSLALQVKKGIRVELENIIVKGTVEGLINEGGIWDYPDVLNLWPVVPHRKNCFAFEMAVPVSCALETDIDGLSIITPGLNPGSNIVHLEVDGLKEKMILFGEIDIRSTYLKRIISVSGGTFGVPPDTTAPDRDHPRFIGGNTGEEITEKDTPRKSRAGLFIAAILLLLLFLAAGAYLLFERKEPSRLTHQPPPTAPPDQPEADTRRPEISVRGVEASYSPGQSIHFSIFAQDDQALESLLLEIEGRPVEKPLQLFGTFEDIEYTVSTDGWPPGDYSYILKVADKAGNTAISEGSFSIRKPIDRRPSPADTQPPTGSIRQIRESYVAGETVEYQITAEDDKDLSRIVFNVRNSEIRKSWQISGPSAEFEDSFSTDGWRPGVYSYYLTLEDGAKNTKEYMGSFVLKDSAYGQVNIFTSPWTQVYIDEKSVGSTPLANLKLKAGKIRIRFVNNQHGIDETKIVTVEPDQLTRVSFKWNR